MLIASDSFIYDEIIFEKVKEETNEGNKTIGSGLFLSRRGPYLVVDNTDKGIILQSLGVAVICKLLSSILEIVLLFSYPHHQFLNILN